MVDLADAGAGFISGANSSLAMRRQVEEERYQQQAQIDAQIQKTIGVAEAIIKSATDAGKDPSIVAKAIQPLIEGAAKLAAGPGGKNLEAAQRVMDMGQALLARTPLEDRTNIVPVTTNIDPLTGDRTIRGFDKNTGNVMGGPKPNTPLTPDQTVNLGDKEVTGVSVTDVPPSRVAQAPGIAGVTADAIELRARQLLDGNENAVKGLPRSRAGMAVQAAIYNRAAVLAKEKGLSPEEVNALTQKFKATTKGAQVLGGREATLVSAISNVTATAPIVAEISDKISRTEYPLVNQIIMAAKEQTGSQDVVRLGIALNTVTTSYARAQGGGNNVLTDHAREEAKQLLQIAYSDGQLKAGVDQLLIEMQREKTEIGHALENYLKLRKDQIQQSTPKQPPKIITPGGVGFTLGQ